MWIAPLVRRIVSHSSTDLRCSTLFMSLSPLLLLSPSPGQRLGRGAFGKYGLSLELVSSNIVDSGVVDAAAFFVSSPHSKHLFSKRR